MCEELEILEFLESDSSQENRNSKIERSRLRNECNPLRSDAQFIKRHRLSKELVRMRNLVDELKPHLPEPKKSTDLSLETKLPQSSYETASIEEPLLIQVEEVPLELPKEKPHEALQPPPIPSNINEVEPSDGPQPERRRRRRRRESQMSQEAARRSLVKLSRERLQLEVQNARTWEHMLSTLQSIANTLDRIASGPQPRNEGALDS